MDWKEENNRLVKSFKLTSFKSITDALVRITEAADQMNHHPDFKVYNYNIIEFSMFTHDAGSVTDKDFELAKAIDDLMA
jgi:4a-hydroxytetrahydrobiopterin dehydratase